MLVGAGPFDSRVLREAGFDEMRRIIREDEPAKLTARLKGLEEMTVEIVKRRQTSMKEVDSHAITHARCRTSALPAGVFH